MKPFYSDVKVIFANLIKPVIPPDVPDTPTAAQYLYGTPSPTVVTYNGVELPDIESVWTDKETYPYATIYGFTENSGVDQRYRLMLTPFEIKQNNTSVMKDCYFVNFTDGEWDVSNAWTNNTYPAVAYNFVNGSSVNMRWTSHDILNSDSTTYLAASDPVYTQSGGNIGLRDGDTVTYYDGVIALPLPTVDVWNGYPYLLTERFGDILICCLRGYPVEPAVESVPNYWNGTSYDVVRLTDDDPWYCGANYLAGKTEWSGLEDNPTNNNGQATLSSVCWANFDLYDSSGKLYLKATEPIPVGEQVDTINDIPIYEVIK